MKSVADWRRWFASAENDTRTRQEIEDENLGAWPYAPHLSPARHTNLGFAGDLYPVGVAPGVTPEQLADPAQRYRLAGPNGLTCAEMLSDGYRREDDESANDEAETEAKGFSVLGVQAWPRGNYDSNIMGDPDARDRDIDAQFAETGGITYRVRRERDGRTGIFRGTGFVWESAPSEQLNVANSPADTSEQLFDRSQERKAAEPTERRDTIMRFFAHAHLPEQLAAVSAPFGDLAERIHAKIPPSAERTVALRKLLEAKDAAVRAILPE